MEFLKNLYTQNDFDRLTTDDLSSLQKELNLELGNEVDVREYLFKNMDMYEGNEAFTSIVSSKVLAGRTSLKWMRFYYAGDFDREKLKNRIESSDLGYNANTVSRWNPDAEDGILSIQLNRGIYTVRIFINDGTRKSSNGIVSYREPKRRIVIVNVDIDNRWIEFRCVGRLRDKAIDIVKKSFGISELFDIPISNKYGGSIEEFKKDLTQGYRFSNISIPKLDFELDEQDKQELVKLFALMDTYLLNRKEEELVQGLSELSLDFAGTPVLQVILSNIGVMKFSVTNESRDDLGNSLIYMLTKDYAEDSCSYIRFSMHEGGTECTMRISIKDSSISFTSSATEEIIEYIRSKVL